MKKLLILLFSVSAVFASLQYNTEFENLANGDTLDYDLHLHPPLDSIKDYINGGIVNASIDNDAAIRQSKIDSIQYTGADWIHNYTRKMWVWSSGIPTLRNGRGIYVYINDTTANDQDFRVYTDSTELVFKANKDSVWASNFRCDTTTLDSVYVKSQIMIGAGTAIDSVGISGTDSLFISFGGTKYWLTPSSTE